MTRLSADLYGKIARSEAVWGKSCYLTKCCFWENRIFIKILKYPFLVLLKEFLILIFIWGCPHLTPKNQNDTATDIWDIREKRLQITTFASHALKAGWIEHKASEGEFCSDFFREDALGVAELTSSPNSKATKMPDNNFPSLLVGKQFLNSHIIARSTAVLILLWLYFLNRSELLIKMETSPLKNQKNQLQFHKNLLPSQSRTLPIQKSQQVQKNLLIRPHNHLLKNQIRFHCFYSSPFHKHKLLSLSILIKSFTCYLSKSIQLFLFVHAP